MRPPRHKTQADFSFEHALIARGITPICGVDEAGRGPLAGPVVASAVILTHPNLVGRIPDGLNDSKALSQDTRERLLNDIIANCFVGIGIAPPEEIDRVNILQASLNAMARAVQALPVKASHALIDGNHEAPLACPQTTLIKGDARSLSIAAASIVAKVTRDRLMAEAERRYPGYGFAQHKGYPTKAHREAVAKIGPCSIHRRSFAPIRDYCDIIDIARREYRVKF